MSYILTSNDCQGVTVRFSGKDDLMGTAYGKRWSGTLALQDRYEDQSLYRVVFSDTNNIGGSGARMAMSLGRALFGGMPRPNPNELCHFDFTFNELRSGKKTVTYYLQEVDDYIDFHILSFRDTRTNTGCNYRIQYAKDAEKWAEKLGIKEYVQIDKNGNVDGRFKL